MSNQSTKRWLVYLPAAQVSEALTRYGSDDKMRELLCAGLVDVMDGVQRGTLGAKRLAQSLQLAAGTTEDTVVLVSLRVPLDTHYEFDLHFGAYGSKTAAMRYILSALVREDVYRSYHQFVDTLHSAVIDTLGGIQ